MGGRMREREGSDRNRGKDMGDVVTVVTLLVLTRNLLFWTPQQWNGEALRGHSLFLAGSLYFELFHRDSWVLGHSWVL